MRLEGLVKLLIKQGKLLNQDLKRTIKQKEQIIINLEQIAILDQNLLTIEANLLLGLVITNHLLIIIEAENLAYQNRVVKEVLEEKDRFILKKNNHEVFYLNLIRSLIF